MGRSKNRYRVLVLTGVVMAAGCAEDVVDDDRPTLDDRIFGGYESAKGQFSFVVSIQKNGKHHCGGTHIAPGWILTAAHCLDTNNTAAYTVIAGRHDLTSGEGWVVGVEQLIEHDYDSQSIANDIALLRLDQKLPVPTVALASRHEAKGLWDGELATVVGWGSESVGGSTSNVLQQAALEIVGVGQYCEDNSVYPDQVGENCPPGEYCDPPFWRHVLSTMICIQGAGVSAGVCDGDSGGPALVRKGGRWVQIGITSWGSETGCAAAPGVFTLVSEYRDWIISKLPATASELTPGDFDGVNGTDVVALSKTKTQWWLTNANGTVSAGPTRTDLPLGHVEYTPGNFYGGNPNDLVITTSSGSYFYRWTGTSMNQVTAHGDLPLGAVSFTPFDMEGNGWIDYAVTTPSGTGFWLSAGNGTFTTMETRPDLALGEVEFTPGDFDADTNTDLVITTEFGSYWYGSNGNGTFTEIDVRKDLPLGAVEYVVGDFDGQLGDDLVVTTGGGSFWYFSNGNGTWWEADVRSDLPLGTVQYVPGDFDGDGLTDLVVTTSSGSYWYRSNGDGTWSVPYTRTDLPLGRVRYTPGDADHDGRTDFVITTEFGSYWYRPNANGTWSQTQAVSSLTL
jgi:secreted trypsin-like serine protease